MSKKFLSGINVTGTATLNTVADAGSNTDKFLVLDSSNNVSYRTAAELYADLGIGVTAAAYTSTLKHEVKASQTISKGQAVYVSSADGTNMVVSKASNVSEQLSSKTMGLLETSLVTNGKGNVITEGLLSGLNTNGAVAGDPVWLGVDGALIYGLANKPVAPAHLVFIGIVTRANSSNGEIFVKVQNGFEMNELHNYQEGSVQNNQVIVYESSTSLYKPKTIPTILGYTPVPDSRTITINGTTYDLSANRAWTITTDASARSILRYVATANQTTFTISGGYTPGLTDVYRNGVKLDNSTDFTATNGTTIVLTNGASVNDVIEVYRYQTAFLANNALRTVTEFIATAGQTTFSVTYNTGLVDVFYNGSKLVSTEYTAGNGTSIVLNFPCNVNDTLEVHAYSYAVGAFTGQAQLNGTGFVKVSGTTVTYDNSTYLTTSAAASTYLTTASAATTYLPISGGTLTGALTLSADANRINSGYEFRFYRADNAIYTRLYDAGTTFTFDNRNGNGFSFQSAGSNQFIINSDGAMGFNYPILGSRSFIFRGIAGRVLVMEAVEAGGVHSIYLRPNSSGRHLISSNYLSGGVYLPLALSGRENDIDFVLENSGIVNIGIGSAATYGKVNIKSNSATTYAGFNIYSSTNDRFIGMNHTGGVGIIETENAGSGVMTDMAFRTGGSEKFRITVNGDIGNGTIKGGVANYKQFNWGAAIIMGREAYDSYYCGDVYYDGNTWRKKYSGEYGNVVNWYSGQYSFQRTSIAGSADAAVTLQSNMYLDASGNLTIRGALTQNGNPSDINLKENIVKITSALDKLMQINGYNFDWKEGSSHNNLEIPVAEGMPVPDAPISSTVRDAGLIAQEVEIVMPELVRDNGFKALNYNGITALLVECIKDQQAQIEELKALIAAK